MTGGRGGGAEGGGFPGEGRSGQVQKERASLLQEAGCWI